ncbi:MAG: EAL domain-containing protein [Xenococcaceae cyanobacterium MO_188.B29]|nr:EAL domain-containing protein [Xenococcaceae cyanobacterium MO_188.B29]
MFNKICRKFFFKFKSNSQDYLKNHHHVFSPYNSFIFLASLLITGLILGARQLGQLETLELAAYDQLVNLNSNEQKDPRLLVVEITESDIQQQNQWPLADEVYAELLATLQKYQPKVIGLDIHRNISHPPGTDALRQKLKATNVITIEEIGRVLPAPGVPTDRIGFSDLFPDRDNVIRRNFMYTTLDGEELYSFSLRLSLSYLRDRDLEFEVLDNSLRIGDTEFIALNHNSGGYQRASFDALGWEIMADFKSKDIAEKLTLTEVLADNFDPNLVKDKVVLIGTNAPGIKDFFYTPYNSVETIMPGVIVHAHMTSQILSAVLDNSRQLWFWNEGVESFWIWGWSIVGAIIAGKIRRPLILGIAIVAGITSLWGISFFLFIQRGWIPFVPAVITFLVTAVSIIVYKIFYNLVYDSLTDLPNRILFTKQLKKLNKQKKPDRLLAIFCLDLDRFKLINEGLGYKAGDKLLVTTAKRLKTHFNSDALIGKVGGDEFAIAIKDIDNVETALSIANKLKNDLTLPFQLDDRETFTTVTIGIAVNQINQDFQPEYLLRSAQTAMHKAKASGKASHQVFAVGMHDQALKRLQLEADLREAIDNQEFELYYQPIIYLKTGQIAGFESLIRWNSPKRGFVYPDTFIPIAEETGLIIPLGKWILQEACQQMYQWQKQFPHHASLLISVNLSGRQFSQPNLVEQIKQTIATTKLNCHNLKLEITESMVMDDIENAIILLHQLKNLGICLTMDDFGTGFSSFSYLHRFPIDNLKIDKSFIRNMNKGSKNIDIVSSIVMLGHKLGMEIIAEGIETEEEMKTLQGLNSDYGQGYFFAKPISVSDATKLLSKNPQW